MKKEKNNKAKVENKSLEKVKNKEKFSKKFMDNLKSRWLISRTNTLLLIAILIAAFILINIVMKKIDLTPIDCTTEKTYTLTNESKDRVKNTEKDINIYLVGYEKDSSTYDLIKQYGKVNSKINVEVKDITTDLDFANKYNLSSGSQNIIIENGKVSKVLSSSDLMSYDSSYNTVDLTEEKVTSAILTVISENIPNIYFLTGYTKLSFENGLSYLKQYLEDEVLTYKTLDLLNSGKVPEDCNTLVIINPEKDFDELTANAIIDYIKLGGNIVWLGGIYTEDISFTNVNRVLAEYGVDGFEKGYVYENNNSNTILNYPICFKPEVQYTDVTKNIYQGAGVVFLNANKINVNEDKLSDLNVSETKLIESSSSTYFSTDMTGKTSTSTDQKGSFTLGDLLVKTISEATDDNKAVESKLIIYGNELFTSDYAISNYVNPMIYIYNNKDLLLNSIAYLTDKDEDITIRKDYSSSTVSFTPTDGEKQTIMTIIFAVPLAIIFAGIIVKIIRKSRK